jgi:hypothetical protein
VIVENNPPPEGGEEQKKPGHFDRFNFSLAANGVDLTNGWFKMWDKDGVEVVPQTPIPATSDLDVAIVQYEPTGDPWKVHCEVDFSDGKHGVFTRELQNPSLSIANVTLGITGSAADGYEGIGILIVSNGGRKFFFLSDISIT